MELGEFIQTALEAIVRGVHEAQKTVIAGQTGARINPDHVSYGEDKKSLHVTRAPGVDVNSRVELVEFDLAVTTGEGSSSKTGGKGGVNIQVVQSNIGTEWSKEQSIALTNRLTFVVPMVLPREQKAKTTEELAIKP